MSVNRKSAIVLQALLPQSCSETLVRSACRRHPDCGQVPSCAQTPGAGGILAEQDQGLLQPASLDGGDGGAAAWPQKMMQQVCVSSAEKCSVWPP